MRDNVFDTSCTHVHASKVVTLTCLILSKVGLRYPDGIELTCRVTAPVGEKYFINTMIPCLSLKNMTPQQKTDQDVCHIHKIALNIRIILACSKLTLAELNLA